MPATSRSSPAFEPMKDSWLGPADCSRRGAIAKSVVTLPSAIQFPHARRPALGLVDVIVFQHEYILVVHRDSRRRPRRFRLQDRFDLAIRRNLHDTATAGDGRIDRSVPVDVQTSQVRRVKKGRGGVITRTLVAVFHHDRMDERRHRAVRPDFQDGVRACDKQRAIGTGGQSGDGFVQVGKCRLQVGCEQRPFSRPATFGSASDLRGPCRRRRDTRSRNTASRHGSRRAVRRRWRTAVSVCRPLA